MTKVKPQRIDANNSPQVGYVPKYVDEQTFEWWAGSGATDIWNNYLILTWAMAGTPPVVDIADTRITDTTPYLVFYETEPVGQITRTLTNGNLNIVSDDNADTLDVKVLFWNIWPARNYMKGNTTLTGAWPWVISDARFTNTSPVMIMPRTTPVWYITAVSWAWTVTISSTWTEVGVIVDYICTLDTNSIIDWLPMIPSVSDTDMILIKETATWLDKAATIADLKTKVGGMWWYEAPITTLNLSVVAPTGNVNSSTHSPVSNERANITFSVSIGSHWGGYSRSILFQESDDELVWNTIWSDTVNYTWWESRTTTLNLDLFAGKHYRTRTEYSGVTPNWNASSVMITYIK